MEGSFQFNPDASPFVPASLSSFPDKAPEKQAESSSKGDLSVGTSDPSQHEEHDMDPLALAKLVSSMFPNVSRDFIDAILEANGFDVNLTMDMIHELNSPDMLHDDAELGLPTFPDNNELHAGKGISGADNHHADAPETCSNLNQAPQDEKAATSAVKPVVVHNDLGAPGDDKSVPAAVAE